MMQENNAGKRLKKARTLVGQRGALIRRQVAKLRDMGVMVIISGADKMSVETTEKIAEILQSSEASVIEKAERLHRAQLGIALVVPQDFEIWLKFAKTQTTEALSSIARCLLENAKARNTIEDARQELAEDTASGSPGGPASTDRLWLSGSAQHDGPAVLPSPAN